jgi:TonB family protein
VRIRCPVVLLLILMLPALAGCGRGSRRTDQRVRLPVDVFSDTARSVRLAPSLPQAVAPPPSPAATVWLARVSPAPPASPEVPAPAAAESLAIPWPDAPVLAVDEDLKPPIPRAAARLRVPSGARPGWVALDVRVDVSGSVTDAEWAGGSSDSALVRAATDCAFAMRFFPALQSGHEVAVWCRQRFDFGRP